MISGLTGTGKTEVIAQLSNGLDLEGHANHRGSSFGQRVSGQPTQIDFENRLAIDVLKKRAQGHETFVLEDEGRQAAAAKRTAMSRLMVGKDDADLATRIGAEKLAELKERDAPVGTPSEVVQKLGEYAEAGIQGVMLQLLEMDDITMLETFAAEVLPQLR